MAADRDKIVNSLQLLMHRYPSMRIGQIIDNAMTFRAETNVELFYVEDHELARKLENYARAEFRSRDA